MEDPSGYLQIRSLEGQLEQAGLSPEAARGEAVRQIIMPHALSAEVIELDRVKLETVDEQADTST